MRIRPHREDKWAQDFDDLLQVTNDMSPEQLKACLVLLKERYKEFWPK